MNPRVLLAALAVLSIAATAQSAPPAQCPFAADVLSRHFGVNFKPGVPEPGIVGKGCTYTAGGVKLWFDGGPNPAPSAEMFRKMSNPPGTTWTAVRGDADKAVHMVPKADAANPTLSYERKGWLVNLVVTGVSGKAEVDAWNAKLVRIERVP